MALVSTVDSYRGCNIGYNHFRYARRIDGDTIGLYHNDMTKLIQLDKATANTITMEGGLGTGKQLSIAANTANAYPSILMIGAGAMYHSFYAGDKIYFRRNAVNVASVHEGGDNAGGVLGLKETTTPTAVADWGAIYTKNDNKVYFQDGAGVEHEVAFV